MVVRCGVCRKVPRLFFHKKDGFILRCKVGCTTIAVSVVRIGRTPWSSK